MYCWGCLIVTIKILVVLFFFFLLLVLFRCWRACRPRRCAVLTLVSFRQSYVQTNLPTKFPTPAAHDAHALANLLPVATSVRPWCV